GGTGHCGGPELHLALGTSVRTGIEQALPPSSEIHEQKLRTDETYIKVKGGQVQLKPSPSKLIPECRPHSRRPRLMSPDEFALLHSERPRGTAPVCGLLG